MARGTVWLIAGLLSGAVACYPDPNDLRGGDQEGSGGQLGSSGGSGGRGGSGGSGGSTGAGGAVTGIGGRAGAGGATTGVGGGPAGTGGRLGTGGVGVGGRTGTGGAGVGGSGTGGNGAGGSGGSTAGRCGAPPCGGAVVGTWDLVQSCTSPTMNNPNCPGETVSFAGTQRVGFVTFNSDLTYTSMVTVSGTYVHDTPTSCLAVDGFTCADLDAAYQIDTQPPATLLSASCTSTTVSCRCVLGWIPRSSSDAGFYGTSGTQITITSTVDDSTDTDNYCVAGNTMRLIFPDSTPSAPQENVFQKR